jgi:hypothetical protein
MGEYLYPHIELETLRIYVYVHDGLINKEIDFHTTKNSTSLSTLSSILKDFWELMSVGVKVILLVEDDTMGKHLHPYIESRTLRVYVYVHYDYGILNKEIDFHITKNSTSLSALGSILEKKKIWEPMSVGVKVILLVEDDKTLYIPSRVGNSWGSHVQDGYKRVNEEMDSHTTKIRQAFRRSVPF